MADIADLPPDLAALAPSIAQMTDESFPGVKGDAARRLLAAQVALCAVYEFAPAAPFVSLHEAAVRLAAWEIGNQPHARRYSETGPDGSAFEVEFGGGATANGLRMSGASALLARFRRPRAGLIS